MNVKFYKLKFLLIVATCMFTSSCNMFEEMSSKDTEEAILYSARMSLGKGDWDAAITEFAKLSAATLATTRVVVDRASAYSGRCGLDFLVLAEGIKNMGTTNIFDLLSDTFVATTAANAADCKLSEDLLKTIADVNGVVSDERGQFLMAFNSLAKIGAILNYYSDTDDDDDPDAFWDPCDGNGTTDLPNADLNEIATGIVLFYKNLQGTSYGSSLVTSIDAICTAIDSTPQDFCDTIDSTAIDGNQRQVIRAMVREETDGIGLNINTNNGDTAASFPGCPNS